MTRADLAKIMEQQFSECTRLRDAGQREYARAEENAFANFERVSEHLGITREQAVLCYALKHLDGITAYVNGHKSQREDVRGRIGDLITYLCILRGMVEENETAFIPSANGSYKTAEADVPIIDLTTLERSF